MDEPGQPERFGGFVVESSRRSGGAMAPPERSVPDSTTPSQQDAMQPLTASSHGSGANAGTVNRPGNVHNRFPRLFRAKVSATEHRRTDAARPLPKGAPMEGRFTLVASGAFSGFDPAAAYAEWGSIACWTGFVKGQMHPTKPIFSAPQWTESTLASAVIKMVALYRYARSVGSCDEAGKDFLSREIPSRLDELLASGNFDVDKLEPYMLYLFHGALSAMGALEAARSCKLQLESLYDVQLNGFLKTLAQQALPQALPELAEARRLCHKLAGLHSLQQTAEFQAIAEGLMKEALLRRYQSVLPEDMLLACEADARALRSALAPVASAQSAAQEEDLDLFAPDIDQGVPAEVQGTPERDQDLTEELQKMLDIVNGCKPRKPRRPWFQSTSWRSAEGSRPA